MKRPASRRAARGFTLIEVLVALAIVAFGLTALFTTLNQAVRTSDYLREKTLATWIALNQITQARLDGAPPGDEAKTGTIDYAGGKWRWELKKFDTTVKTIVRLEARAAPADAPENAWPGLATGFMDTGTAMGAAEGDNPLERLDLQTGAEPGNTTVPSTIGNPPGGGKP